MSEGKKCHTVQCAWGKKERRRVKSQSFAFQYDVIRVLWTQYDVPLSGQHELVVLKAWKTRAGSKTPIQRVFIHF